MNSRFPFESVPSRPSEGHRPESGPEPPVVDPAPELEGGGGFILTSPTAAAATAAARNSSRKEEAASGGTERDFFRSPGREEWSPDPAVGRSPAP